MIPSKAQTIFLYTLVAFIILINFNALNSVKNKLSLFKSGGLINARDKMKTSPRYFDAIVPNLIHFVLKSNYDIDFLFYLTITAAFNFQDPDKILIHSELLNFTGVYWTYLKQQYGRRIEIVKIAPEILANTITTDGLNISHIKHLYKFYFLYKFALLSIYGGIVMEYDYILLRNLDEFRHFEYSAYIEGSIDSLVHGRINPALLISTQSARILQLFSECWLKELHNKESSIFSNNLACLESLNIESLYDLINPIPFEWFKTDCKDATFLRELFEKRNMSDYDIFGHPSLHLCRSQIDLFDDSKNELISSIKKLNPNSIKDLDTSIGKVARYAIFGNTKIIKDHNKNDNSQASQRYPIAIVPNFVHFILVQKRDIDFIFYVVIKAALKFQKPDKLYIHTDQKEFKGRYWPLLLNEHPNVVRLVLIKPEDVPFNTSRLNAGFYKWHFSDMYRIVVLMRYGGIMIDHDHVIFQNMNETRHYEYSARTSENNISPAVQIGFKEARILPLLLECWSKIYKKEVWGSYSNTLTCLKSLKNHEYSEQMIHHLPLQWSPKFACGQGMVDEYFFRNSWPDKDLIGYPSIHICRAFIDSFAVKRYEDVVASLDEQSIKTFNASFGRITRYILYGTTNYV